MEIQSSYISYLFALGLGQSAILFTALLKSKQQKSVSRVLFMIIIVIIAIEILFGLLYQTGSFYDFPHLLRFNTPIVLLIAPTIYLSLRYFFQEERKWSNKEYWHFTPFLIGICYFIPLYFSPTSTKVAYLDVMFHDTHFDSFIFGGFRRLQQGIYLSAGGMILWKSRKSIKLLMEINFFKALFAVFCLLSTLWLMDVYRYFFVFDLYSGLINVVLMSSLLLYFTLKTVSNQSIFDNDKVSRKYDSSGLDIQREAEIAEEVETLFEAQKLYLNTTLKLSDLASELGVPAAYLSQSINNQLHKNFSELVNEWRVKEAKLLLENPENHKLTLAYIASTAGFKSTSGFNAAFKQNTGLTPSQYRKNFSEVLPE